MMAARQRPEAFAWSPPQVEFQGGVIAEYAHYFDPNASSAQPRLEFFTVADVFSKPSSALTSPQQSVPCEYKFNELSWSPSISEAHPSGIIFGGTENGTVVFLDAHQLVHSSSLNVISSRRDHQGHVLSVDFSSDARWAISAGAAAQLLLWDLTNLATPFSPGAPNFTDQVRRVRWNRSMANIVASLSSQRGSLWDMRRPGGPILEFAEIGSGCDWADLCWKPNDSSTLIVASQLALAPGVQKWDLRYPTAPVNEYHVHERGVTAIDWHKKDPRMVVSAGNDGFARVFNPDNGEILGAVQLQQNDRARAITWSEARPDLLAIQYHQHATEFRSIETGSENATVGRMEVSIVPQWVSAAPVGSSFAKGGRMATHYRQWDEAKQIWRYTVEVKKLPVNEALYQSAMELQNAQDANTLGQYCEDRAHETNDRNLQVLWTFLAALSNKQGRREFVRILGFGGGGNEAVSKDSRASRTSVTSHEVTQLTNIMSSRNDTSPRQNGERAHSVSDDESSTAEEFARQADLNWNAIGSDTWSLVDALVDDGEETVVDKLLAQKDYATAFMLARDNANLMHRITEKYIAEELAAPQRLLSLIATDGFDQLVDTFPREQWSRLLALVLARADRARLVHTMRKIAAKWLAEGGQDAVHAAFAAVLAQDVDLLLASNRSYSSEERTKQAMVLRSLTGADVNEEFEKLLYTYCEDLIAGGVSDAAWRILSKLNTKDERLLSLRHDLFLICGGEERTMTKEPENPRSRQVQAINNALHPSVSQQRNPVFTSSAAAGPLHHHNRPVYPPPAAQPSGMTPTFSNSSYGGYVPTPAPPMPGAPPQSSYQPGYYAPTPPPPVPMPPPVPGYQPAAATSMYTSQPSAVPGFSQAPAPLPPPPIAPPNMPPGSSYGYPAQQGFAPPVPAPAAQAYSQSSSRRSTVSPSGGSDEIRAQGSAHGWNDPPALAARKPTPTAAPVLEINWKPLEQAPVTIPNGLPGAISGTPIRPPSSASSHHPPEHKEIPEVTLTPEDQAIMDRLQQLVDAILAVNRTPMAMHKAEEAKNRLGCELAPRLANGKLSLTIRQLLWQCAEQSSHGNYRGATAICGQMVRTGGDFVEVSAFLPALKSLFSLAQSTFAR